MLNMIGRGVHAPPGHVPKARYPCAAPPPAPSSHAVWAVLTVGGVLPCAAVPAPCAGAVAAFWAVNSASMRRLCSVSTVFSWKVLNCSSVSGMVSDSSFSKSPMRLQSRFVLSLRSCSFCFWISRLFMLSSWQISSSPLPKLCMHKRNRHVSKSQ